MKQTERINTRRKRVEAIIIIVTKREVIQAADD